MAYVLIAAPNLTRLPYLPLSFKLEKSKEHVVLQDFSEEDFEGVYNILKEVVEEGQSYPHDTMDQDHFRNYYLSHRVFVLKTEDNGEVIGCFYVKPNFPGRSSHICNAGFAVKPSHRGQGALQILTKTYLRVARDLGYSASFFNLVFVSNTAAVHVYDKLGFIRVGLIPKAGLLRNLGYVDAIQFYYDLTTMDEKQTT